MSPPGLPGQPLRNISTKPDRESSHFDLNDRMNEVALSIKVSQTPPTKAELDRTIDLCVLNANHEALSFKSLYDGSRGSSKVLILFIRHFFCGNCQEYLRTLCSAVSPESLLALPTPTEIIVIGCGQPDLITFYAETTSCPFPIYADPHKQLYVKLGMARTLSLGSERPKYMQRSLLSVSISSFVQALSNGRNALRGGDFWQVGGEFLFENGEVRWCHRMSNTRDHTSIPELRERIGLVNATSIPMRKRWSLAATSSSVRRSISTNRWSRSTSRHRSTSVKEKKRA